MKPQNDTVYRVITVPKAMKKALAAARVQRQTTNCDFLYKAVESNLETLISDVSKLGLVRDHGEYSPIRLPFSKKQKTLEKLRTASKKVQLPVSQLMIACLRYEIASTITSGNRRRGRKASVK